MWCDAASFDRLLDEDEREKALELYRGDLLEGFHVADCPEFERWLEGERARLRNRAVTAARSLAEEQEKQGNAVEAARWARRAAALTPYDEEAHRSLLQLLTRLGDRAGALQEHEKFRRRLAHDLELEPGRETRDLAQAIRAGESSPAPAQPKDAQTTDAQVKEASHDRITSLAGPRLAGNRRRAALVGAGLGAVLVLAAGTSLFVGTSGSDTAPEPVLDARRVLATPFVNAMADSTLDPMGQLATDRVLSGLARLDRLHVVVQTVAAEDIGTDGGGAIERAAAELLAAASSTGAATAVWGTYYPRGPDSVEFRLHLADAGEGTLLASLGPSVVHRDDPHPGLDSLRERLTAAVATFTDVRLARWAKYASKPRTLDAYTEFVNGLDWHVGGKCGSWNWGRCRPRALEHYLNASSMDSQFTLPLLWALWISPRRLSDSIFAELKPAYPSLPPLERHLLDYHRARHDRDIPAKYRAIRRVVELAPESGFLYKAGDVAMALGRAREAVEFFQRADPEEGWLVDWLNYWGKLTTALHRLERYEEALEEVRRARRLRPDVPHLILNEASQLAALGRVDELRSLLDEAARFPHVNALSPGGLMLTVATHLEVHGHAEAADEFFQRGIEWFDERAPGPTIEPWEWADEQDPAAEYLNDLPELALALTRIGRGEEGEALIAGLRAKNDYWRTHVDLIGILGVLAAVRGEREEAMRYYEELAAQEKDPEFSTRLGAHKMWRGKILGAVGEKDRAVDLIQEALRLGYQGFAPPHSDAYLRSLHDYPPFRDLIQPIE